MEVDGFTGSEIGFLRGGGQAAVRAALATLHRRGAIRVDAGGRLEQRPAVPAGSDPLESAVHAALVTPAYPVELAGRPRVRSTLTLVRDKLTGSGLIRPPWFRIAVPLVLLAVAGPLLAWLTASGRLPGVPGLLLAVVALAAAADLSTRRTLYGSRALRRLRIRYADLREPGDRAALTAAEAGMAAALFGASPIEAVRSEDVRPEAGRSDPVRSEEVRPEAPGTTPPPGPRGPRDSASADGSHAPGTPGRPGATG